LEARTSTLHPSNLCKAAKLGYSNISTILALNPKKKKKLFWSLKNASNLKACLKQNEKIKISIIICPTHCRFLKNYAYNKPTTTIFCKKSRNVGILKTSLSALFNLCSPFSLYNHQLFNKLMLFLILSGISLLYSVYKFKAITLVPNYDNK